MLAGKASPLSANHCGSCRDDTISSPRCASNFKAHRGLLLLHTMTSICSRIICISISWDLGISRNQITVLLPDLRTQVKSRDLLREREASFFRLLNHELRQTEACKPCNFVAKEGPMRAFLSVFCGRRRALLVSSISIGLAGAPSPRSGNPFLSSQIKVHLRESIGHRK